MGKKLKNVINDKRGVSIVWVLITMLVLFTIGASVLTAALATQTARLQYQDNKDCMYFAKTVSKILADDIEGNVKATGDPWRDIAQAVYDANIGKIGADATEIEVPASGGFSFDTDSHLTGSWVNEPDAVKLSITLTNQRVDITTDYRPAIAASDYGLSDSSPEILERTNVSFEMHIRITVFCKEQQYSLNEIFQFNGKTTGTSGGSKTGIIDSGSYSLKAISTENE